MSMTANALHSSHCMHSRVQPWSGAPPEGVASFPRSWRRRLSATVLCCGGSGLFPHIWFCRQRIAGQPIGGGREELGCSPGPVGRRFFPVRRSPPARRTVGVASEPTTGLLPDKPSDWCNADLRRRRSWVPSYLYSGFLSVLWLVLTSFAVWLGAPSGNPPPSAPPRPAAGVAWSPPAGRPSRRLPRRASRHQRGPPLGGAQITLLSPQNACWGPVCWGVAYEASGVGLSPSCFVSRGGPGTQSLVPGRGHSLRAEAVAWGPRHPGRRWAVAGKAARHRGGGWARGPRAWRPVCPRLALAWPRATCASSHAPCGVCNNVPVPYAMVVCQRLSRLLHKVCQPCVFPRLF